MLQFAVLLFVIVGMVWLAVRPERRDLLLGLLGAHTVVVYALPYQDVADDQVVRTFLTLLLVAWALVTGHRVRDKPDLDTIFSRYTLLLVVFGLLLIVSSMWSAESAYGLGKGLRFATRVLLPAVAVALMRPLDRRDVRAFVLGAAVASFSVALRMVVAPVPFILWRSRMSIDNMIHPNAVARDVGVVLVIVGATVIASRQAGRPRWVVLVAVLAVGLPALLLTGSRGPLLAVVVGLILGIVIAGTRTSALRAVFGLLLGIGGLTLLPGVVDRYEPLASSLERIESKGIPFISEWGAEEDDSRTDRYRVAFEAFQDAPVLGVGSGGFADYWDGPPPGGIFTAREYPHNLFLETAAETGLIGFGVLVLLLAIPFVRIRHQPRFDRSPYSLALASLWVYAFFNAQVSGDLGTNTMIFVVGAVIAATRTGSSDNESPVSTRSSPDLAIEASV